MTANKDSYLSFKLGNEIFAVSVHKVLEVLEMQNITRVPKTPDYIRGVINFRGEILPVVETRKKFNLPDTENETDSVIIILDLLVKDKAVQLGAITDGVSDVLEIKKEMIKDVPELGSRYNTEFLDGMVKVESGFIMILNMDKVFSVDELNIVTDASEAVNQELETT